jgi:glycine/D-amino acid oxidase-like deaminating enzyme
MHAPALGQLLAEIILEGRTRALDVRPLRPERFAEGEPNLGGKCCEGGPRPRWGRGPNVD